MSTKTLLMTAALLAMVPMAACTTTSTQTPSPRADLTFAQMKRLQLNVGDVKVVDQTGNEGTKFEGRVSPAASLRRYANQRLQAVGGEGVLNFVIQQATLTAAETNGMGDWTDAFQLSKPVEYTVTMRVGLDLVGRTTQPNVRSAYTLERKKILPAGSSLVDRDRELNLLIEDMIKNVDIAVEKGLADNMRVLVTPGPITFGQPAPMESSGAVVVPPSTAGGKPVVIQGTMD